jgi:hypothetical protein
MIERLFMIGVKIRNYSFVKDRVSVVLEPNKMESCPKPPKGEGNNLLSKAGVEKALMESTYPMP